MIRKFLDLLRPPEEQPEFAPEEKLQLATCVLLLEAANADDSFTPEECRRVVEALKRRFDLPEDEARLLMQSADELRAESGDMWRFTHRINQMCSNDEKRRIIEEVWRVIYADGELDGHEDYLVHKYADLLNLHHGLLIDAKMKVLGELRGGT